MPLENGDKIIGAKAIAFELSCSIETVYRRAEEPGTPIYKPAGRYIAFRGELREWMKAKPTVQGLARF